MRVLFLHPEDVPWQGEWVNSRWDLIVDLGFASSYTYEEWSRRLGARVLSIHTFSGQTESYRWVNQVLERGRGRLLDRLGLDWWEIVATEHYQDLHMLYLFYRLRSEIALDEIDLVASRPDVFTRILGQALGRSVRYFQSGNLSPVRRLARTLRSARHFRPSQIAEIAFDKWDPCYGIRRQVAKHNRAQLKNPVVLLPSAYSNVTRSTLAYAAQLPKRQFLLATTRRSAGPAHLPANVQETSLAAYALPLDASRTEVAELRNAWELLLRTWLPQFDEFRQAAKAGLWEHFPQYFENGMRLRNAWKNLLESEPVKGVLCGDDLNYYTRLPLILAHRGDLNAVYCSHGALDGGFLFKMPFADSFLVKGEMEKDYLLRARAIEPEKIQVGAPGRNISADQGGRRGGALVFFSQPYEVEGGRADEIYREILPRLCSVANRNGRKVIVKLHPFESPSARRSLVASILPKDVRDQVEMVSGVHPEEVMSRAWCGVTVDSSVAVECALRGIPFFLCGWLDFGGMGYLQQFARFKVAQVLGAPDSIKQIPEMVANYKPDAVAMDRLWYEVDPAQLEQIMFGTREVCSPDPCAC